MPSTDDEAVQTIEEVILAQILDAQRSRNEGKEGNGEAGSERSKPNDLNRGDPCGDRYQQPVSCATGLADGDSWPLVQHLLGPVSYFAH